MNDRVINLMGSTITVLTSGEDTDEAVSVLDVVAPPGTGVPPHTHREVEVFYVLDGCLEVELDGDALRLGRGETAAVPSGAAHAYRNTSESPVRFLAVVTPGGFERFLAELAAATATGDPGMVLIGEIADRHGVAFVGAPAPA